MYKEVKGNLITMTKNGIFDVICHGANCQQMMGAGIALQIRKHFPLAYANDKTDSRLPRQRLGDLTYAFDNQSSTYIVNLYSQFYGGKNLDYVALELSLIKLSMIFEEGTSIGLPLIGCGIAGGDWEKVRKIIKKRLSKFNVTIVFYEK